MKHFFAPLFVAAGLLISTNVFAAPAAHEPTSTPCTHCDGDHGKPKLAASRAGLFGYAERPCPNQHSSLVAARWGNAQKPCPDCPQRG
ncbi:MAG: hypothetical protein QM784_30675 [Polyangiaceae bacterium]